LGLQTKAFKCPKNRVSSTHRVLVKEGFQVNLKKVRRIWWDEGLKVTRKARQRARVNESMIDPKTLEATCPDHVWALDFQADETADGRQLRLMNVVDEFTRQVLGIEVARPLTADRTVHVLECLIDVRGKPPAFIRMDNGPELTANALRDFCQFSGTGACYIDPGTPWQNAYVESLNARVRDEFLNLELSYTLPEAQFLTEA
ncbi:MAG TPA: DDE-type integrase/transposase/recombinase, partial [Nitrospira sp.]|nr:DDE-type integrase/transposase/recombinase [Nitrospira sp.]